MPHGKPIGRIVGGVPYLITIKTSEAYADNGPRSEIKLEFVGKNNKSTGFFSLNDDQCNEKQQMAKNVGLPSLIRIKRNSSKDNWFCKYIVVGIEGEIERVTFPIYDWIIDEMEVAPGEATLPQKLTNKKVIKARKKEIKKSKQLFQWIPAPEKGSDLYGLPRYVNAKNIDELPLILKWEKAREEHFETCQGEAGINMVIDYAKAKIDNFCRPLDSYDDFTQLYKNDYLPMDNPLYLENWQEDSTMGRQVLTGINPLIFSRCNSIPEYFNVTNHDVANLLDEGKTLEDEMKAGKVYISDFVPLTTDIPRNKDLYCANCVGLFYVKGEDFLPIAIQLVPDDRDYLFTPNQSEDDWLLAKMHFRCTSGSIHEWIYHFLYTHNIMEPFCVALFRCLPKAHPVYKLLRPHLQTVCEINTDARTSLILPDSKANQVIALSATKTSKHFFKTFKFEDLVIPKRFKKQGTNDPNKLPGYYYRDDSLRLWKIMEKFVRKLLEQYYTSDKDVLNDYELQDWAENVANEGLNYQKNNSKRFPTKIDSLDMLIETCVTIMFTSSAQHAAVNFGQFETYKFIPNSPGCMRKPPHKRGQANKDFILESLPNALKAGLIIAITYALSTFSPNDVFIGQFPERYFTEEKLLEIQRVYTSELEELEQEMKERNEKLGQIKDYEFLIPGRVPRSIGI